MNYQQAIADAIRQITFRSVAAAVATTADAAVGFGFSCFCAAVAATTDLATSVCQTAVDADATMDAATTADAAAGSGFSSFCAAVAATTAADADAANVLIPEGPHMRALSHCNIKYQNFIYMIKVRNR